MVKRPLARTLTVGGTCLLVAGCGSEPPAPAVVDVAAHAHGQMGAMLPQATVAQVLQELRAKSAPWHSEKHADEAGYTMPVGCTDERTEGLSAADARGMGYHTLKPSLIDAETHLLDPELLVYGRDKPGGPLKLAGFDYFIPGAFYPAPTSPGYPGTPPILQGLGTPLMWNDAHNGWIAHIWLWKKNPDGIFDNFNPEILLCECQVTPDAPLCTP